MSCALNSLLHSTVCGLLSSQFLVFTHWVMLKLLSSEAYGPEPIVFSSAV
jgi:hypothetical protein